MANDTSQKKQETKERPIIQIIEAPKDTGSRKLIIALIVCLCLTIGGYALTVDSFTDYNPPDYLSFQWYDYAKDSPSGLPTTNNAVSDFPRWSVEYPYRAIFLQGKMTNSNPKKYDQNVVVVYSKVPTSNLFTFEYMSGDKTTSSGSKTGYIRAYFSRIAYNAANSDIQIVTGGGNTTAPVTTFELGQISSYPNYDVRLYEDGTKYYFDFDFFYDCADEHQQNAQNLNISGITNISGVPYNYIINCDDHTGYTGGGGGSSSGGSGSGGSNGSSKWGGGKYGGGVDFLDNGLPNIKGGGSYSSRDDLEYSYRDYEYSRRDDWEISYGRDNNNKYPWEYDNNVPDLNIKFPVPPYTGQGKGDTGKDGSDMQFPVEFPTGPNNIFEINIPPFPNADKLTTIDFPAHLYFYDSYPPKMK